MTLSFFVCKQCATICFGHIQVLSRTCFLENSEDLDGMGFRANQNMQVRPKHFGRGRATSQETASNLSTRSPARILTYCNHIWLWIFIPWVSFIPHQLPKMALYEDTQGQRLMSTGCPRLPEKILIIAYHSVAPCVCV